MGRFIQYSGSLLVFGVLLLLIYRILIDQGFVRAQFSKQKKVAIFFELGLLVIIMEAALFVVGFIIYNAVFGRTNIFELETIWLQGDARNMVNLAGNWFSPGNTALNGVLPFYPLILRLLGNLMGRFYFLAGVILSTLSLITACYFLYQLVTLDYDEKVAKDSVKFLLFFPFIFYLFFPLADSLFLALTCASFYYMRRQKWLTVAICSLLAVLCDLRGILLILPIGYEFATQDKKSWRILYPLAFIAVGFSSILVFNQLEFGNPLAFLNHYSNGLNFINPVLNTDYKMQFGSIFPSLILLIVLLIGGFFALGRIRTSYLLYAIPLSSIAFFITWLDNRPRFFAAAFPLFIELGLLAKNRTANLILLFLFIVLMGFYLFCFINFKMSF